MSEAPTADLASARARVLRRPRPWGRALWERLVLVLVFRPAKLAEFLVGGISLTVGLVLTVWGSPISSDAHALLGGAGLALFAAPQMAAAVWGSPATRHLSNVLGCAAALGNLLRAHHGDAPVAMALFAALFLACLLFWIRGSVQRHTAAVHLRDEGRKDDHGT